uniref:V-type proton ATPase subunit G n=2 Tax=Moniliophthora roreri TaxID=221103 RepID=A0A0W0FZC7_MONRR
MPPEGSAEGQLGRSPLTSTATKDLAKTREPVTSPFCHAEFETVSLLDTDMSQQSQGIQTLLEAEKEAAKIVQQARQYRVQRLKDARAEASKEIEEYKKAKEDEFKSFEASRAGTTSNAQAAIDKETEIKLNSITESYNKNKDAVVKKLLDRVVLVKPELHRNLKKVEA